MVTVKGIELPYSDTRIGNLRLMEYQEDVLYRDEKVIAISAPTGSGKTLAILKKALDTTDFGESALFLYPTNELLTDQLHSFTKLLEAMGYDYSFFELDAPANSSKIKVLPVNGEHLEFLSRDRAKGSILREILNSPEIADSKLLILSNIDFIYNIVKSRYHLSELIYHDLLKNLSFIAVDELHMYWGTMFLSLLFSLKTVEDKVRSILLSTATHTENLKVLLESLNSENSLVTAEEGPGRVVRYSTELEIITLGDVKYLSTDEHAEKVLKKAEELLEERKDLLCIFNSVMFAEKFSNLIEKEVGEEVGRIHGFVPKEARKEMRKRRIKVGTSSVEVGVDFDIEALIFEANTATSFIQRFGRAGRHRGGVAIAITPVFESKNLRNRFKDTELHYKELESIIWNLMEVPEDFSRIKYTRTGIKMYLAYSASLAYLLKRTYKAEKPDYLKIKEVKEKIDNIVLSDLLNPGFERGEIEKEIKEAKKRISWARDLINIAKIFPRGGTPTIPAYFEKYGTFEVIPLTYLEKADLRLDVSKNFPKKPPWLKSLEKSEEDVPVFVVENINHNNYIKIGLESSFPVDKPGFLREKSFSVRSEWDSEVNRFIEKLLKDLPACFTHNKPGWMFSSLKARKGNRGGYLLIGGDALIWSEKGST